MPKSITSLKLKTETSKKTLVGPKESTVSLIKQFARIYSYKGLSQPGLRSLILN